MFQLKIYDLMQKEQDFMANKVMFLSSKGWLTILPHHAPLFTHCLPEKIIFSFFADSTESPQAREQSIIFKNPGFLSFDGKMCQIWIS